MNIIVSLVLRNCKLYLILMKLIQLKTKKISKYHFGCHANGVTMAVRYVAYLFYPKESPHLTFPLPRGGEPTPPKDFSSITFEQDNLETSNFA